MPEEAERLLEDVFVFLCVTLLLSQFDMSTKVNEVKGMAINCFVLSFLVEPFPYGMGSLQAHLKPELSLGIIRDH